jgi:hypothetical protein
MIPWLGAKETGRRVAEEAVLSPAEPCTLRCHDGARRLDERRVGFAAAHIYSTVGYTDAALALPAYTDV